MSEIEEVDQTVQESLVAPKWYSWNRFSEKTLIEAEEKLLSKLKVPYKTEYIDLGANIANPDKIWTISINTESRNIPMILLHGLGGGIGIWINNLEAFAEKRPIYAFDLLGFGRSSRPDFSIDGSYIEHQMVKMVAKWIDAMKLEQFILLGHSLGGYLATSYAIEHPNRVKHLILGDPWGISEKPAVAPESDSMLKRYIDNGLGYLNPLAPVRLAGPFGQWLLVKARPALIEHYNKAINGGELIATYLYHLNSQYPSGERGFYYMSKGFCWAKYPMIRRLDKLDKRIPITFMRGTIFKINEHVEILLKEKRKDSYVKAHIIQDADHHIYVDHFEEFNKIVLEACDYTDKQESSYTTK